MSSRDVGFIGPVKLETGVLPVPVQVRDSSMVPATPTGTPTCTVYGTDGSSLATPTIDSSAVDGTTGFMFGTFTPTAGFAAGQTYPIRWTYVESATTYAVWGTLIVT